MEKKYLNKRKLENIENIIMMEIFIGEILIIKRMYIKKNIIIMVYKNKSNYLENINLIDKKYNCKDKNNFKL